MWLLLRSPLSPQWTARAQGVRPPGLEVRFLHGGRQEGIIVASRIQINGSAPIRIDWQLNPTNHGYKVIDVIVDGVSRATMQHADLVSVIQRNGGMPALLLALREKNASNGILR